MYSADDNVFDAHHDHHPSFAAQWVMNTNYRDTGTLYLIFAPGVIGDVLSVIKRTQLMRPRWNGLSAQHRQATPLRCCHGSDPAMTSASVQLLSISPRDDQTYPPKHGWRNLS